MNERRWKQYFRQAGKYLYCDTSQKDIFEKQIRAAIADLQNENPMISYEECIAIIGTPQDAAGSFLDTLPENVVAICHRKKRRRTWLLRIGGAVLMGILAFSIFYMWKSKKFRVVEVNTTIVDFGNVDTSDSDWDEFPNLLE